MWVDRGLEPRSHTPPGVPEMATRFGGLSSFLNSVGPSSFGGTGAARPVGAGSLPNLNPANPSNAALKAYSGGGGADGFDAAPRTARGPNLTGAAPARAPQLDAAAPAAPAGGAQAPAGPAGAQDPNAPKDPNAAPATPEDAT